MRSHERGQGSVLALSLLVAFFGACFEDRESATTLPKQEKGESRPLVGSPERVDNQNAEAESTKSSGNDRQRRVQNRLENEDLEGLGELGFLPHLIQSLTPGTECDFDDAMGNCQ